MHADATILTDRQATADLIRVDVSLGDGAFPIVSDLEQTGDAMSEASFDFRRGGCRSRACSESLHHDD